MKSVGFVDKNRFKQGVKFDARNGILHFAHKKGMRVQKQFLVKAVKDAGFQPVFMYELKRGKVMKTSL